ncbi:putative RNA-binding protein 25 [Mactra antiquata]
MSFPPRPPVGMPQMTGMMSTGYAFAPMGMMPMGMGMMPPTTMIRPVVTNAAATVVTRPKKQLVPQEIDKDDKKEEKPPVTTVFVGNISDRAPDSMVRTMLQRCGNVLSWKRVQGASGKLQAFGFCEYEDPEATLRCMRLLNEWEIADKKLVVKVDAKTKTLLDEWKNKKKKTEESKEEKEKNGDNDESTEEGETTDDKDDLDEFTLREDRVAQAGLDAIMREYAFELAKEPTSAKPTEPVSDIPKVPMPPIKQKDASQLRDTGLDDLNMEADTKDLINREIQSFRNLHKDNEDAEVEKEREREKERELAREKERRMAEERRRKEKEREMLRLKELERYDEMRKVNKNRQRESRSRSRSRSSSRGRTSRRSRSRERERERDRRARDRELEEEEEAKERRKMEKKIREMEIAYQERLKNWEARERKKSREYDKEREREEERKNEEYKEARRLREFLEDYDDERDDPKFYKGSALERRLRERQKEKEVDARDRAKEKEELEDIRRKLLEEGHPDLEAEMAKIEREREEHLRPMLQIRDTINLAAAAQPHSPSDSSSDDDDRPTTTSIKHESEDDHQDKYISLPNMKPTLQPIDESSQSNTEMSADDEASRMSMGYSEDSMQPVYGPNTRDERLGFGAMKLAGQSGPNSPSESSAAVSSGKRKKLTVGDVFNQDDDDSLDGAKKRKLVPLDYGDSGDDSASGLEGKKATSAEEKRAKIKTLIENIPTAKDELFAFQLDWRIVDQSLMDKRIKPWVNKKIIEYIGEEEPTLTDFICQKVMAQSPPQNILNDVAMVLDEEAEVFVVKMWRLLVYETEAKKAGLVK